MLGNDANQAADELARWAENLERTAQRYQGLQGRMRAISVTERSADGRIAVTVDADGVTTGIELAPGTRGMDPAAVAAELMACTHRAQARLRRQVGELVHDLVGQDGAGQAILAQYAERFPDPVPAAPRADPAAHADPAVHVDPALHVDPPVPADPTPPAAYTPPPTTPGTRKPDRDRTIAPAEPDADDLYYRRRSWLE